MALVYFLLLVTVFFSWKGKKVVSNRVWFLAFGVGFLILGLFIYHALSPLEIKI